MSILGDWDVKIKTPIGTLAVAYSFTERDGLVDGSATGMGETTPLRDVAVAAQQVTWKQSVTKPMRVNLDFEVTVDGDRLSGYSRAGRLPRSAVTGVRVPDARAGRQGAIS